MRAGTISCSSPTPPRTSSRAALVCQLLRARGVDVFWTHEDPDRPRKDELVQSRAAVVMSTIQSAKGLEFPRVVLFGLWREHEEAETNRRLAYVGMTRATERLAVVTRQGHPLVGDLRRALRQAACFPPQA